MTHEQDLADRLRDGQVVVIVGAGVSIATVGDQLVGDENVASWLGLLRHGIKHAAGKDEQWKERRLADLEGDDVDEYVIVADSLTSAMHGRDHGVFAKWLVDTVGALQPQRPDLIRALQGLGAPIATTNYDNLIEDVTGWDRLTWMDGSQWQPVLRRHRNAVLHLHGHYLTPPSVILGVRSYEAILHDEPAQAMLRALGLTSTFLLVGIGAGLDDPNFGALRAWLGDVAKDSVYPHYRLVHAGELTQEEMERDRDHRIEAIVYGNEHSQLEPWLRALAPERRGVARRAAVPRVLELTISREAVVAKASPRGVTAEAPLGLDVHRVSMIQMIEDWLRRRDDPDTDMQSATELREAQLLGRILYDSIIHGQIKVLYDEELAQVQRPDRLALVLRLERAGVASLDADPAVSLTELPWELLYGPSEGWLARYGRLTLFRALPHPKQTVVGGREPLRILVVRAQPADVLAAAQSRWDPDKVAAYDTALGEIREQFHTLEEHPSVEDVTVLERPTLQEVNDALLAETPPNIVHYIGYDTFNTAGQKRYVALVAPNSLDAQWADALQFADQFSSVPPKLVFLHLCEGPREGYPEQSYDFARASFTELARLLLDRGVQLVVAMQYPMSPDIGAKFTRQFYDSIRAGESVGQAVQAARQQAAMFYRLGAPVLYLHSSDEALVEGAGRDLAETPRPGLRVVSTRDDDIGREDVTQRDGPAETVRTGPQISVVPQTIAMRSGVSLEEFQMVGEVVAQSAGMGKVGVDTFRQQVATLWATLSADRTGRLEEAALAAAARGQAEQNPSGAMAPLWSQLSEKLEPARQARVGFEEVTGG